MSDRQSHNHHQHQQQQSVFVVIIPQEKIPEYVQPWDEWLWTHIPYLSVSADHLPGMDKKCPDKLFIVVFTGPHKTQKENVPFILSNGLYEKYFFLSYKAIEWCAMATETTTQRIRNVQWPGYTQDNRHIDSPRGDLLVSKSNHPKEQKALRENMCVIIQ